MTTARPHNRGLLLTLASFVIVVAGMRAAQGLLVPFLLASFIAIICAGPMSWLQKRRVPAGIAVLLVILAVVGSSLTVLMLVGSSVNDFTRSLPEYQQSLRAQALLATDWLQGLGLSVSSNLITDYFDPGKALEIAGNMLARTSGVLANAFMILLTVVFILLEAAGLPAKLRAGLDNAETSLQSFERFNTGVQQYLAIKTLISLATGIIIAGWLMFLGLDYPLLWGLVAFLLNYIPNIGSIIAAVPAVLLAIVQLGPSSSLMVAGGYVAVNLLLGSVLEPKLMGRKLGLSTLVVFLSLVFWGWVLGPVGMLLSVPLTMIVKIALEVKTETRWLALMLGSEIPPMPLEND